MYYNFKGLPAAKYKGVLAPPCRFVRDTGIYFLGWVFALFFSLLFYFFGECPP